jgi:L-threonylcarbamoyladenylate synthase
VIVDVTAALAPVPGSAYIGVDRPPAKFDLELISPTVEAYAHALFEFFRECDRRAIETIYCERVAESGIGTALMDRITRAAADR